MRLTIRLGFRVQDTIDFMQGSTLLWPLFVPILSQVQRLRVK